MPFKLFFMRLFGKSESHPRAQGPGWTALVYSGEARRGGGGGARSLFLHGIRPGGQQGGVEGVCFSKLRVRSVP